MLAACYLSASQGRCMVGCPSEVIALGEESSAGSLPRLPPVGRWRAARTRRGWGHLELLPLGCGLAARVALWVLPFRICLALCRSPPDHMLRLCACCEVACSLHHVPALAWLAGWLARAPACPCLCARQHALCCRSPALGPALRPRSPLPACVCCQFLMKRGDPVRGDPVRGCVKTVVL